ncbi:glycosyltransferase family 4 protein [Patescibacteria group bacterium]
MKIAIQAADLDDNRIDGTRVYLLNMLKYFGEISSEDEFFIYHKNEFNPELTPKDFSNYKIKRVPFPFLWTQTRFALELLRGKTDVLWMPMHNIPVLRRNRLKTVVTIHDLAFKIFPEYFTKKDLRKLNFLADLAIKKSDKVIAVSESTKSDILKFYPEISKDKIKVIYHGFDGELFEGSIDGEKVNEVLSKFRLKSSRYLLYVGAIQPRKNLTTLIKAFELYKDKYCDDLKLVLAGERAWLWEDVIKLVNLSRYKKDIILTEGVSFEEISVLYRNASIFVFPSLYEGFGIPILEAFAAGVPVIAARNSSLIEVGGDAAEFFKSESVLDLSEKLERVLRSEGLRSEMILKGKKRLQAFSWKKCAEETLGFIKSS